jgi:hypothetical protein
VLKDLLMPEAGVIFVWELGENMTGILNLLV